MSEDCSSAEVDVQLYGPATQLSCVLDEGNTFAWKQYYCNGCVYVYYIPKS